ncbi:PIN domain-containing protein [Sphingobium subterraneum]|uniref:Putative nucleic-acid-binding protein n=1 Tax=Sphingobium subterraneum TaxID=627688 RepID=A0A841IXJ4_9SPHN|nr:putative nucleic-acid-binding protein [Sphingobium subterraneum]
MKIAVDTNVLVRAITADDPQQTQIAERLLADAELVAIPAMALCELCWVLGRIYNFGAAEIGKVIRTLVAADNVVMDHPMTEAGLALLDAGGDFTDGVIAHNGQWLGGDTFASFDRKAIALLEQQGANVMLPQ